MHNRDKVSTKSHLKFISYFQMQCRVKTFFKIDIETHSNGKALVRLYFGTTYYRSVSATEIFVHLAMFQPVTK